MQGSDGRTPRIVSPVTADEYIDDLPLKGKRSADARTVDVTPDNDSPPIKRVAHGPGGVLVLLCAAALVMIGWATAALQYTVFSDRPRDRPAVTTHEPKPQPVPTVTKTVTVLPASCRQALYDMGKYLDAAAAVGDAHNKQLDIIDDAYQAILMKDWKGLNDAGDKQRELGRSIAPASSKVLPALVEVRKEMDQCRSDAG